MRKKQKNHLERTKVYTVFQARVDPFILGEVSISINNGYRSLQVTLTPKQAKQALRELRWAIADVEEILQ